MVVEYGELPTQCGYSTGHDLETPFVNQCSHMGIAYQEDLWHMLLMDIWVGQCTGQGYSSTIGWEFRPVPKIMVRIVTEHFDAVRGHLACCFYTELTFQAIVGLIGPKTLSKHMNIIIPWHYYVHLCQVLVSTIKKHHQKARCCILNLRPCWIDQSPILNSSKSLLHFYKPLWIRAFVNQNCKQNDKRCSYVKKHGNHSMNLKWDFGQLNAARL